MRRVREVFRSKETSIMNFGLLLGAAIAVTGTAALLFVAYWAFNVSAVSLLGLTGVVASLLGPVGLCVALGVGLAALIGSAVYLNLRNQKPDSKNTLGGEFNVDIYCTTPKTAKKSAKFDLALSVVSGFVSVAASVAVALVAALGLLNPVGFALASVATVAIFFVPIIKLFVDAVRAGSASPARVQSEDLSTTGGLPARKSPSQNHFCDYQPSSLFQQVERVFADDEEGKDLGEIVQLTQTVDPLVHLGR